MPSIDSASLFVLGFRTISWPSAPSIGFDNVSAAKQTLEKEYRKSFSSLFDEMPSMLSRGTADGSTGTKMCRLRHRYVAVISIRGSNVALGFKGRMESKEQLGSTHELLLSTHE